MDRSSAFFLFFLSFGIKRQYSFVLTYTLSFFPQGFARRKVLTRLGDTVWCFELWRQLSRPFGNTSVRPSGSVVIPREPWWLSDARHRSTATWKSNTMAVPITIVVTQRWCACMRAGRFLRRQTIEASVRRWWRRWSGSRHSPLGKAFCSCSSPEASWNHIYKTFAWARCFWT